MSSISHADRARLSERSSQDVKPDTVVIKAFQDPEETVPCELSVKHSTHNGHDIISVMLSHTNTRTQHEERAALGASPAWWAHRLYDVVAKRDFNCNFQDTDFSICSVENDLFLFAINAHLHNEPVIAVWCYLTTAQLAEFRDSVSEISNYIVATADDGMFPF